MSFIVLAFLRADDYGPFGEDKGQRDAWSCLFAAISLVFLFIANLILLNLFWGYVINVNKTIKEIEEKEERRLTKKTSETDRNTIGTVGIQTK